MVFNLSFIFIFIFYFSFLDTANLKQQPLLNTDIDKQQKETLFIKIHNEMCQVLLSFCC